jgi:S1-C subfamily serine protease
MLERVLIALIVAVLLDQMHAAEPVDALADAVFGTNHNFGQNARVVREVAASSNASAAVIRILPALTNGDSETRRLAAWALWWFGTNTAPAVPLLIDHLNGPGDDAEIRRQFTRALGVTGQWGKPGLPVLFKVFSGTNESDSVRIDARLGIQAIDTAGEMRKQLHSVWRDRRQPDAWRREAFEAFHGTNSFHRNLVDELCATLKDNTETDGVRNIAAEMLVRASSDVLHRWRFGELGIVKANGLLVQIQKAFQAADRNLPAEVDRAMSAVSSKLTWDFIVILAFLIIAAVGLWITKGIVRRTAGTRTLAAVYVVESPSQGTQGSAFFLAGVGFVTCWHVIEEDSVIFHNADVSKTSRMTVLKVDRNLDLAVFAADAALTEELKAAPGKVRLHQEVMVVGFPKWDKDSSGTILQTQVTGKRKCFQHLRFTVDTPIIAGSSGGPVIDWRGRVVGVASGGPGNREDLDDVESRFIPIEAVYELIKREANVAST